jgi:hypothetical protein
MSILLPRVKAEPIIIAMTPAEGTVGTTVNLVGNMTTANGTFQVLWDNAVLVSNATAVGNSVNVSFSVPPSTLGNHTVMLLDVAKKENQTTSFSVLTAYSLNVLPSLVAPAQSQEGDSFRFSLGLTGGDNSTVNAANFTVRASSNVLYTNLSNVMVRNDGNGTLILNYPADFAGGANTNLTGVYNVAFNDTVATGAFYVGLTNQSAYHRNQALDIKAVYVAGENVSLSLTGTGLNHSENVTADDKGVVHYVNSTILSSASANSTSTYTVNLTSVSGPTIKSPADVQNFTVPGFAVNITARNLAGEPVPNVGITVFENLSAVSSMTTDSNGLVTTLLEVGSYFSNSSFGDQELGELSMIVNETSTVFDISCNLTDLMITVADEDGVLVPNVGLYLYEENQPLAALQLNATDINGTAIAHSILPLLNKAPIDYALNASRYGTVFNTTRHLELPVAPVAAWFNMTVIVPKMNLQVNVTDGSLQPIGNATVTAMENEGGVFYSNATSADGTVTLRCTFGQYLVRVYADGIEINETAVNLNDTIVSTAIICALYGLDVSVMVSDYFGQPIPNLTVILQGTGYQHSIISGSNGLAVFRNVVGGQLQFTVYSGGQSNQLAVETVYVSNSTTIGITVGKYFVLGGMLVEIGPFVTVTIIVLSVVFVLLLEVHRQRRLKRKKSEG